MSKTKRFGFVLTAIAGALMLSTIYLAIFYAPLSATSVKSADAILSTIEGSEITVSGFVTGLNVTLHSAEDLPDVIIFSLADFSDYQRYVQAEGADNLSGAWWTVRPLDVRIRSYAFSDDTSPDPIHILYNETNLSVVGRVVHEAIGQNSEVVRYSLEVASHDVTLGSPGEFSVMTAPVAQKIFYFHMPSAWVSYVAFLTTLVASALYLRSRDIKFDRIAMSAAEIGVLFATVAISTGPVWAKQEWGVYWRWDDTKLVTTFVLWLVYIGYLSLRAAIIDSGTRARVSAVYGILSFVTVPMSLLSSRIAPLIRSSHPKVIATSSGGLSPEAGLTVGIAVIAFTIMFIAMLIRRVEIAEDEEDMEELKRSLGGEE